jgi:hypothetical protein
MRYVALLFLILFSIALVVKKINKDYSYLECLFFTAVVFFIGSVVGGLVFIFINFW